MQIHWALVVTVCSTESKWVKRGICENGKNEFATHTLLDSTIIDMFICGIPNIDHPKIYTNNHENILKNLTSFPSSGSINLSASKVVHVLSSILLYYLDLFTNFFQMNWNDFSKNGHAINIVALFLASVDVSTAQQQLKYARNECVFKMLFYYIPNLQRVFYWSFEQICTSV